MPVACDPNEVVSIARFVFVFVPPLVVVVSRPTSVAFPASGTEPGAGGAAFAFISEVGLVFLVVSLLIGPEVIRTLAPPSERE